MVHEVVELTALHAVPPGPSVHSGPGDASWAKANRSVRVQVKKRDIEKSQTRPKLGCILYGFREGFPLPKGQFYNLSFGRPLLQRVEKDLDQFPESASAISSRNRAIVPACC